MSPRRRRVRIAIFAAFCTLLCLAATPSKADLVRMTFNGQLTRVDTRLSPAYAIGNAFGGDVVIDTASPLGGAQSPDTSRFDPLHMTAQITINGNTFLDANNTGFASVTKGTPCCDSFQLTGQNPIGPNAGTFDPTQFMVGLWSTSGAIL